MSARVKRPGVDRRESSRKPPERPIGSARTFGHTPDQHSPYARTPTSGTPAEVAPQRAPDRTPRKRVLDTERLRYPKVRSENL